MYNHILISTDGSEVAQKGVDHGLSLAKALGAKVTAVTVTEPYPLQSGLSGAGWVASPGEMEGYEASQKEYALDILAKVQDAAAKLGVVAETVHVPDGWPANAIVETAKTQGYSLIVMGSHGRRGLGRLLLGSQTSEVLSHSPVPVLVVR
jgi:nucleotide-binding universal stress UspA family protein